MKQSATTFYGKIDFSGTSHAGLILNSLTTVQRDALTAVNGMIIYNTTTATVQKYEAGAWVDAGADSLAALKANNLSDLASASTARTNLGLVIGTDVLAPTGSAASLTSFPTLNQSTTGSAAILTTPRSIYGNNFDGSVALTQVIASTYGGTGNAFTKLSGPATTEKTFTLPNASATILTDNAAITVAQGGTGQTTYTDGQLLIGNSTGNTLAKGTLTGTANQITVTNSSGSITLSSPQNIATSSTPTFAGLNLGSSALNTVGSIAVDGSAVRDITVARSTTGAGVDFTLQSGGALAGGTNSSAGNLILSTGTATGNARGDIYFKAAGNGGSGSGDSAAATLMVLFGTAKLSIGNSNNSTGLTDICFGGNTSRTISSVRHTTANTAGNSLILQAGGSTSGATDKAGGDLILKPGISTGTGASNVKLQTYTRALSTGTADNTATDRIIVTSPKSITNNSATTLVSLVLAAGSTAGGTLRYTIEVTNGTDYQVETGEVFVSGYNKAGVFGVTATKANAQQNLSTGTLATTWAISSANPAVVSINANSSLTPSTGYPRITYTYENYGQQSITIA